MQGIDIQGIECFLHGAKYLNSLFISVRAKDMQYLGT